MCKILENLTGSKAERRAALQAQERANQLAEQALRDQKKAQQKADTIAAYGEYGTEASRRAFEEKLRKLRDASQGEGAAFELTGAGPVGYRMLYGA